MLPRRPPVALILTKAQTQSEEVIRALRVVRERACKRLAGSQAHASLHERTVATVDSGKTPVASEHADIDPLEASSSCVEASAGSSDVAAVELPSTAVKPSAAVEQSPDFSVLMSVGSIATADQLVGDSADAAYKNSTSHSRPATPWPADAAVEVAHQTRAAAVPLMPAAIALHRASATAAPLGVASWSPARDAPSHVTGSGAVKHGISVLSGASTRDAALVTCKRELRTLRKGMRQLRAESAIMMSRTADEITRLTSGTRAALQCSLDRQRHRESRRRSRKAFAVTIYILLLFWHTVHPPACRCFDGLSTPVSSSP